MKLCMCAALVLSVAGCSMVPEKLMPRCSWSGPEATVIYKEVYRCTSKSGEIVGEVKLSSENKWFAFIYGDYCGSALGYTTKDGAMGCINARTRQE